MMPDLGQLHRLFTDSAVVTLLAADHRANQPFVAVVPDAPAQVPGGFIFRVSLLDDLVHFGPGDKCLVKYLAGVTEFSHVHGLIVDLGSKATGSHSSAVGNTDQSLYFIDVGLPPAYDVRDFRVGRGINGGVEHQVQAAFGRNHVGERLAQSIPVSYTHLTLPTNREV